MSVVAEHSAEVIRLSGVDRLPARELVGGKAWSLARLGVLGLPVPPAFVIPTTACVQYHRDGALTPGTLEGVRAELALLCEAAGRSFGEFGSGVPMLLSVRSGAPVSMPGMMDTVLNLGLTEANLPQVSEVFGADFVGDSYRRFLEMYATTVARVPAPDLDPAGTPASWTNQMAQAGAAVPQDPWEQLLQTIHAVFDSWNSRRARRYRQARGISDDMGTAVTVQAMVFGNRDELSGTGVLFSRDPRTGDPHPYGQYLPHAQGEDVVSGRATPLPLDALREQLPDVHEQLLEASHLLEVEDGDVQDIEFTIDSGKLYLLQSRVAARSPQASIRLAVELLREGVIDEATALSRVSPEQASAVLRPKIIGPLGQVLASGETASGGVGVGVVVTTADEAERRAADGEKVVLARSTTSPDDVHGMLVAQAVITEHGGGTSHAAVVSRALGLPAVVGCGQGSVLSLAGQIVTVDGEGGMVYAGAAEVAEPAENDDPWVAEMLRLAERHSPVRVVRQGEAPAGVMDLSTIGVLPDQYAHELVGQHAVTGGGIASDEGVAGALSAGVGTIVAEPRLPVMLTAIRTAAEKGRA